MRQKSMGIFLVGVLAFVFLFSGVSCKKLSVSRLQANYHFSKANRFFTDGKFRKAIAEYENTLKYNPNMVEAYRFLGECYKSLFRPADESEENTERANKALGYFTKAYEADPMNKDIIYSVGDMYDKLKNFQEAERYYLRILELEPSNMSNYYVVAEFYKRYAGENEQIRTKAESMYFRRIELDPENPQGYAYMANYFENLPPSTENFDIANTYWDKRIQLDPNNAEAWTAKGVNRWSRSYRFQTSPAPDRIRTAQEGIKALEKAIELNPEYPEPYIWISVLYKSVMAKLEPDKEARYNTEGDRYNEKWDELRKRAADKKKLEEELKKTG